MVFKITSNYYYHENFKVAILIVMEYGFKTPAFTSGATLIESQSLL